MASWFDAVLVYLGVRDVVRSGCGNNVSVNAVEEKPMREIKQIIVHCADTPAKMDIGADEIRKWHVEDNGWSDIGYNFVIRRSGMLENGRDLDGDGDVIEEVGAHARGFNTNSIGICLVGGKGGFNFSYKQMAALFNTVQDLKRRYPEAQVIGHRDVDPGKDCPGFDVRSWWDDKG